MNEIEEVAKRLYEACRIPLHLAIMKGRVEVIQDLLQAKPHSVHEKLGRGETVLHLSVQYNRLEALKTLVEYLQSKNMESGLLYSTDDDDNTILHLAAALKQVEVRGYLITAAALTATMAYQSILSPPGGLWQETNKGDSLAPSPSPSSGYSTTVDEEHTAGHAIMDPHSNYRVYLALNTIVLGASLSTIMLAMSGFTMENKFLTWSLVFTVYITITFMGAAYVTAINLVSPEPLSKGDLGAQLYSWLGICIFFVMVLHSCHFLVSLRVKLVRLVKACYGRCRKPTPRATKNIV
ncbi:hypothetical protein RHGRI_006824 [Rhododendron griersonianum]|uniref:PGG domain-containing protein n=1 Tax=Rhododendron griersonianum TaxID=479676 RepID=A0AAV6KV23_9ERIC|nr:hypothetical protein RHGRI_006824 [Rhododendron griersonianum]